MALSHADVQYYYFCYLLQWSWASEGFGAQDFLWQKVSLLQSALAAKMCLPSAAGWSPRCRDCWALLCIVCQQAGCWGKKFLYLAAPRCSVPVAIAVHCSKLKPVCGVLCLWESVTQSLQLETENESFGFLILLACHLDQVNCTISLWVLQMTKSRKSFTYASLIIYFRFLQ